MTETRQRSKQLRADKLKHVRRIGRAGAGLTAFDYDKVKDLPPLPKAAATSTAKGTKARPKRHVYGKSDDEESPYKDHDSPYRRTA